MAESNTRIVLLGKTGAGKSSLANTIFREKLFKVLPGFKSVTSVCEAKTKSVNGRKLTLIDSPGFFDTNRSKEELKPEIVRCITECSPGPHAFLIVFKVDRFTVLEEEIIHRMTQSFSEKVYKFATVVFTHGDELPEGETIKNLVKQNKSLSDFVEKCGGRCHVIDNKHWNNDPEDKYRSNKYQVEEILKSVEKIMETNNGNCYTNEMLQEVEKMIQQEEKRLTKSSKNMSEEEIRTKAKKRVITNLLNKAAGVTVGVLLGALFGVVLPAALVGSGLAGLVKSAVGAAQGAGAAKAAKAVGAGAAGAAGAAAAGAAAAAEAAGGAGAAGAAGAAAAEAAGGAGAAAAGAAEAAGAAGGAGAGLVTGVVVVGVSAAVGAGIGGYEGYLAAQAAETPSEAAEKAAEAVFCKGMKAIKGFYDLTSQLGKELKYTCLEEKSSKS